MSLTDGKGAAEAPLVFSIEGGPIVREADWWEELDDAIVRCVLEHGSMTPVEMARKLGMSTGAVTSLLARLAQEGRIAIVRVALAGTDDALGAAEVAQGCEA